MIIFYLIAVVNIVLSAVSQALLKKSALKTYEKPVQEYLNPLVIGGYALLGITLLLGLVCYNRIGYLGTVVLEPGAYILVLLIGRAVFGEALTARKAAGMALIVGGILVFHLTG
ncbi:MAG: multidrug ABC transporter [Lachnospiraceae bacterium]|nr:multidrug ABC transporter [Lachnospiraceae bacterium]